MGSTVTIDIIVILKALWGGATPILLGVLKMAHTNFKAMQDRQDSLERDIIRMRADMVTKDSLDELFDRKLKHLQESLQDMRLESRGEIGGMRGDMQKLMHLFMNGNGPN